MNPSNRSQYYAAVASGGVWKTTNSGTTRAPVFDDQPVQAIGALAVSRSHPDVVWAGTGEAWVIRDADVMGSGVYRSPDAGRTSAFNLTFSETRYVAPRCHNHKFKANDFFL